MLRTTRLAKQGFDINSLKSFVSKSMAGGAGGSGLTVQNSSLSPSAGGKATGFASLMAEAQKIASTLMQEKEWQCPCGHKFRASGEWIATVPAMCEVPTCPNPKYYLSGAGRALLEANPSGVKLEQVDPSRTIAAGSGSSSTSSSSSSSSNTMGGRFGGRK